MEIRPEPGKRRALVEVRGTVQGVGFRPFVYRLAERFGIDGDVRNAGGYVVIRAQAPDPRLAGFVEALTGSAPAQAKVTGVDVAPLPGEVVLLPGFRVVESVRGRAAAPEVPPDLATCPECVRELFDPADRRYRYPFLNCTACGPRATIIERLPYDRVSTAMRAFPLCPACEAEYRDPADRRFHAEPIACPECGPRLSWFPGPTATAHREDALAQACQVIDGGGLVAVKGLGGYQLVCDAGDDRAVRRLREVKPRPSKPLAVMVPDLSTARHLSFVDKAAERLLTSAAAPIVLLPLREDAALSPGIAPGLREVGGVDAPTPGGQHLLGRPGPPRGGRNRSPG
ncbi:Sua5/YciO/YrdC/YwlC family protein, partial [Amycolatopsis sp. NPDC059027]|uniref:Sua5/YciO/YrdC/YwlC family protein n=1 Tax=Amycolatopsis sp. NPDC059027 TaxID=3346709 RepID=UPI00366D85DC